MPPHPLPNFEIQKYYWNEPRFNGVYSSDNLPERSSTEIKDGVYIINLDEYSNIRTRSVALYVSNNVLLILIVLEQSIFQKKLKYLLVIKT